METNQQFCLVMYGVGSNGKSNVNKLLHEVLGEGICKAIPFESLEKARGQNNDSLHEARHSRLVTLEESDGHGKVNTATFKNLVCGEEMANKTMYQTETNFKPVMKLLFLLNDLPEFFNKGFANERRTAIIQFRSIFVDEQQEGEKQVADELRSRGAPECLIQVKDKNYYDNHVLANIQGFLTFFVQGAVAYYENNKHISIPASMQKTAIQEAFDTKEALAAFVRERLLPSHDSVTTVEAIEQAFREYSQDSINISSYTRSVFGKQLKAIIDEMRNTSGIPGWKLPFPKQAQRSGKKYTVWKHLQLSPTELQAGHSFAPPQPILDSVGSSNN
jgi:phage/plasmid-associated DNA primase